MTHEHASLWMAVHNLAERWAQTPAMIAMAADLPTNAPHKAGLGSATVTARIQDMKAGAGALFSCPFHYADAVTAARDHPFFPTGPEPVVDDATLNRWLAHAANVQRAHLVTHSWLRSRLPGYPMLRIPYLAPDTHLTMDGPYGGHPWEPGELKLGLQLAQMPPVAAKFLGAAPFEQVQFDNALNQLSRALKETPEWRSFDHARAQLTSADHAELATAKRDLRQTIATLLSTNPTIGQAHTSIQSFAHETTATLSTNARSYCQAFDRANDLLHRAACEVLGQLAAYGSPRLVAPTKIDVPARGIVRLDADDAWLIDCGAIIHLDDPLFPNALQVREVTMRFDQLDLRPSTITALVLEGTSVWFGGQ